ncbi:uncharacterized protein LOC129611562 [Condylostylus longicornis]|uniref:uncharacterized protein LOC129611562 n=1 Tax=Condylostylus longicornis TaxID=2530218 RepID=UPI00244DBDE6|nr:uncharacterized protein LOC129611562 [Condylostylus longicornis]
MWRNSMNEFILKTYYQITRCESDLTSYRQRLREEFMRKYPELTHINEQNLADRRAAIIRNNLVPEATRNRIYAEVQQDIIANERNTNMQDVVAYPDPGSQEAANRVAPRRGDSFNSLNNRADNQRGADEGVPSAPTEENANLSEQIETEVLNSIIMFTSLEYTSGPRIPTQKITQNLLKLVDLTNSKVIPKIAPEITSYEQLNTYVYSCAAAITLLNGRKLVYETRRQSDQQQQPLVQKMPISQRRLTNNIETLRAEAGLLTFHTQRDPQNNTPIEVLDTVKQKLSMYAKRLRRYRKSSKRNNDNKSFERSQKKFYASLKKVECDHTQVPTIEQMQQYCSGIWAERTQKMPTTSISNEIFKNSVNKLQNWKCPGNVKIQNFWLKKLTSLHPLMLSYINQFINDPGSTPETLCTGLTFMKPKNVTNSDPLSFRPITCLNTFYKLTTTCITQMVEEHCSKNNIIAEEQKGCRKGSLGCKEQLTIDAVVMKQAIDKKRNIYGAYIDYRKAFDMVPHSWLIEIMKIYKISENIIRFVSHIMSKWSTVVKLPGSERTSERIPIKRVLSNTAYGFEIKGLTPNIRLTHLLFMDDLKLYSSSSKKLEQQLRITENFSKAINMEFGVDKCKTFTIRQGKLVKEIEYQTSSQDIIKAMDENDVYKYLGMQQTKQTNHVEIKRSLRNSFRARLTSIMKTSLNSKNLCKAINTYAITLITYSAGVIKWNATDLEGLDRLVRTELTRYRYHHPKAAVERVNIPRIKGGRGIINIKSMEEKQRQQITKYFLDKSIVSNLHRVVVSADNNYTILNLNQSRNDETPNGIQNLISRWQAKEIHGRHPNELRTQNIDQDLSNKWLTRGKLFAETEGFMIAIQDQVIATRNYLKYVVRDTSITDDKCRKCSNTRETIQHILAGCSVIAQTAYKLRHDNVAKVLSNSEENSRGGHKT